MSQAEYIAGVDVGGTNTRIGLVDRNGRLMHFEIISTVQLQGEGDFCSHLCDTLARYIETYRTTLNIRGISLGFPSTINTERTVLLSTPNIPNMNQIPIVAKISARIPLPVYIEKDVNMLLLHDIRHFNIPDHGAVISCYIGTGFGNAVYYNGEIMRGKNGVAGELGHIPVMDKNDVCNCGNIACIENYASGRYLESLRNQYFPDIPINKIFTKYAEHEEIVHFIEYISIPIATEINIFDPDYVILGGGILQMEAFPQKLLEQKIYLHSRKPYPAGNLNILYSTTAQENGVIGAGLYGFRCYDYAHPQITKIKPSRLRTV